MNTQTADDGLPAEPLAIPVHGPLDEFTRARLRCMLVTYFGEFATLDLHLGLLDTRGAWYAERAMNAWSSAQPDAFFGVVRHVVRTQIPGPAPQPDIEAWLEAGRPTHDPVLAELWEHLNSLARMAGFGVPAHDRGSKPTGEPAAAAAARLDEILIRWPSEHIEAFVRTYVKLEIVLRRRNIVLPPLGT